MKIAVLPGDGIGTEIVAEAVKGAACPESRPLDGTGPGRRHWPTRSTATRCPSPRSKLARSRRHPVRRRRRLEIRQARPSLRPEQAILGLRKHLGLFANFRPAICYEQLVGASSLKPELIAGLTS